MVRTAGKVATCPGGHQSQDGLWFCSTCGVALQASPIGQMLSPPSRGARPQSQASKIVRIIGFVLILLAFVVFLALLAGLWLSDRLATLFIDFHRWA
jgi:hypothetical protein